MDRHRLLLAEQAHRLLHPLVLFLLVGAVVVVALLQALLVGQGVQAVAVVHLLLVVEGLLLRQVREVPEVHTVGLLFLVAVEVGLVKLVIRTAKVKAGMGLHLLLQEHR